LKGCSYLNPGQCVATDSPTTSPSVSPTTSPSVSPTTSPTASPSTSPTPLPTLDGNDEKTETLDAEVTLSGDTKDEDFDITVFCQEYADRLQLDITQVTCKKVGANPPRVKIKVLCKNKAECGDAQKSTPATGFVLPSFTVGGGTADTKESTQKKEDQEKALAGAAALEEATPLTADNASERTVFLMVAGLAVVSIAGFVGAHLVDKNKAKALNTPFTGNFFLSEYMWTSFVMRAPDSPYNSKERWFSAVLFSLMAVSVVAFRKANGDEDAGSLIAMALACAIPVKCLEAVFRSAATANAKHKENNFENSESFSQEDSESGSESEEDPAAAPPPPPKPGKPAPPGKGRPPPPPGGPNAKRPATPKEEADALVKKHSVEAGKQAVGHATQRARQMEALQQKLESRPTSKASTARPASQQDVDRAKSATLVAQHKMDSAIQKTEHDAERARQLDKLNLAIAARPASKTGSRPGSASSAGSPSPKSAPASPRAWDETADEDINEVIKPAHAQDSGKLPVKARYVAYALGACIVAGLLFFLYLQLPETGTLTPAEATTPMMTCLGVSALVVEPLFVLYLIKKKASAAKAQSTDQGAAEEIEMERRQSLAA